MKQRKITSRLSFIRSNSLAPNKKYYKKLARRARSFKVELSKLGWCDLWHTHFDWKNFGKRTRTHRRKHMAALCHAFHRAQRELASQPIPFQLFLCIFRKNPGSDALYVHTKNPNGTEFPIQFDQYKKLSKVPPLLAGRFNTNDYCIYVESDNEDTWYTVVPN
jgi:hypothetical protein